jgi:flagellar biosynthesis/type III secretory pathway protein FliH
LQKWSPEPLLAGEPTSGSSSGDGTAAGKLLHDFRREHDTRGEGSLLEQLTPRERDAVYQLVEADVAAVYAAKEREAAAAREARLEDWLASFGTTLQEESRQRWQRLARETVDLSVAIAEKIVRQAVQLDRELIVRALETLLYKLDAGVAMTVIAHPDDAAYLQGREDLLARLNVTAVKADRRIERGGCRVTAGEQEWDATLAAQLAALLEIVQENLLGHLELGAEEEPDDASLA